jgi:prolyl 4-hydroxylase
MARTILDEQWKDWVQENVRRGCSRDELLGILLREGFAPEAARRELFPIALDNLRRVATQRLELYTAEGFLGAGECRELMDLMREHLRVSTITTPDEPDQLFRRSKTCDLGLLDAPLVRRIDARICEAMQIDPALGEPMQGQHYEVADEFKPHTDYFESYELERHSTTVHGQRSWTFMLYLNEPEGGGATAFTALGTEIAPRTGMAVIWNNLLPDGRPNPDTLHQGMPVTAGHKAIFTKWFRRPRRMEAAGPAS